MIRPAVFHARHGNPYQRNGGRHRLDRISMLPLRQQYATHPRRLHTVGKEFHALLENNDGRDPDQRPKETALRRTECFTFWPSRDQQDVQRCSNLLEAKHAVRHTEKRKNLPSLFLCC